MSHDRIAFQARAETLGFDSRTPWALDAIRLLASVPRVYLPLATAWDARHPGTLRALAKLTESGFVAFQPPLVVDTNTGLVTDKPGRKVARYSATSKGRRLMLAANEDIRVLEETFPRVPAGNIEGLMRLLSAFNLDDSQARFGLSATRAVTACSLPATNVRWWVRRLVADGYLKLLDAKIADVREVIPGHWRITRRLVKHIGEVFRVFEVGQNLAVELRLGRSRFLTDIDPARVGIVGATDYDHDIECQRILGAMLTSEHCAASGVFAVEPRMVLPLDVGTRPFSFVEGATGTSFYQPDAELRETHAGRVVRSVIEYERFQSRRDAWSHIEKFLGYLSTSALPMEAATLRFVVDSAARERAYVDLIRAFADYAIDHPQRIPPNPVTLAVSSTGRVLSAVDSLSESAWFRIDVPRGSDTSAVPVLHPSADSPYDEYFART